MADRPLLVSVPAPLTRTRAELRAARIAALRAEIQAIESWPDHGAPIRYEVTPAGTAALSEPDSTGSC